VALAQPTLTRTDVRYAERTVIRCAFGDDLMLEDLEEDARAEVRAAAYVFLSELPAVHGDLRTWITGAKEALQTSACLLAESPRRAPDYFSTQEHIMRGSPHGRSSTTPGERPGLTWTSRTPASVLASRIRK
jgi:hypothetical protein